MLQSRTRPSLSPVQTGLACCALLAILALASTGMPAHAATHVYTGEPSGEYMRTWLLCGPFMLDVNEENAASDASHVPGFDTDFLTEHGGETALKVAEGQVESHDGPELQWSRHTSDEVTMNLDKAVSDAAPAVAYAYCEVNSPGKKACVLSLGSNDGARVWLNGEQVWDRVRGGGVRLDNHLVPVILREGRNTLLLKVEERGGSWGFCCRLIPFGHPDLKDLGLRFFEVRTNDAGEARVQTLGMPESVDALMDDVRMTVRPEPWGGDEPATAWEATWQGQGELPIAVAPDVYEAYLLRIEARLADGTRYVAEMPFTAGKRVPYTLFEDGTSAYRIVLGSDASESERWAAEELQHWLGEAGGATLPIHEADSAPVSDAPVISVGFNACTQALLGKGAAKPDDIDQAFTYRNVGPHILIYGGRQSGTMYGAHTFLERELGCRWYTPKATVIPKRSSYAFDRLRYHDAPAIRVRNVFYFEAFDPHWAARNGSNGELTFGDARKQPGGVESYSGVHTMGRFIPEKEFFEEHPEYFSLIDGERRAEEAQVCMTNPDVLRITIDRVRDHMREHPEHLIYSVSQNDGYNPCQCDKCQALVEQEGSESGPILWFVNQVADAVKDEFPDKYVGTLAYVYSSKAPKTLRPRPNVVIRLCAFDGCWAHGFKECPENDYFVRDIEEWSKLTRNLYIWDYVVSFANYLVPFPNFRALQPRIQYLRDHHVIGVMPQAAYQGPACEFSGLRAYVLAKLLWNPDVDVDSVIDDYMYGYFGRSGQHVRRYFNLLQDLVTEDTHFRGIGRGDPLHTDTFVREAARIFDEAEAVADNDEIHARVERARLPLFYLQCARTPAKARRDGVYERLRAVVEREGVTHFSEGPPREAEDFYHFVETAE
jgi:Domain of unknown function (DUF4838)